VIETVGQATNCYQMSDKKAGQTERGLTCHGGTQALPVELRSLHIRLMNEAHENS
jgi:hypothetical protein